MLTSPNLNLPHIRHGFFGRVGGVSEGLYASLNCGYGSGDDVAKVAENRRRVSHALASENELLTCFQIHSAKVITVDKPWAWKDSPEADAMVTNVPQIPLGILTADCLPILFADSKKPIIGAAHAGWKGAISGVIEATLDAMGKLGATEIHAAVGPAIAQTSYEVGPEFKSRFVEVSPGNARFFAASERDGHFMFDLPAYAKERLERANVASINILAEDTRLKENAHFSYRRATLRKEPVYGRQVAAITLVTE